MMNTDVEWERWAVQDPYFGVLTDPRFRKREMTPAARQEFFDSGRVHVDCVLGACRRYVDTAFAPTRVLDFGCGVGRLLIPFAAVAADVVGMDVAPSMLAEARRNCSDRGIENVRLVLSDDALSAADGQFDLVHSFIVLQHIEVTRGRAIFARLVDKVKVGGCGAIHVTFGWDLHAATFGMPPEPAPTPPPPPPDALSQAKAKVRLALEQLGLPQRPTVVEPVVLNADPEMQMNFYNLSELMFIMQRAGVQRVHSEFTDHGGALGVFLYFQRLGPI
jgi:SAM-dependent methyltransferase